MTFADRRKEAARKKEAIMRGCRAQEEEYDKAGVGDYETVKPDRMGGKGETKEILLRSIKDDQVFHMDSAQQMRSRRIPK